MNAVVATVAGGRPRSLQEVVARVSAALPIDFLLREFLDEFYVAKSSGHRQAMIANEPALIENPRANAYLAAVAEHLAFVHALEVPEWALASTRFLHAPFFPAGLESLKAITLVESPTAFRRRLIFVDRDPLSRPRRQPTDQVPAC